MWNRRNSGKEAVAPQLVDALKRLEYRGYDSAGVATICDNKLERRRAAGKLRNLEQLLGQDPLAGTIGIGHTRWATHGIPMKPTPIRIEQAMLLRYTMASSKTSVNYAKN